MPGPLTGIRVFDLTRILAGPGCTQLLADLGADVIKIERPGAGDDTRQWGPPFLKDEAGRDTTESGYYLAVNRNKRSLTLDLTKPKGQEIARRLIGRCDILVENFKVGDLARHGLAYDQLRADNPRLVYLSLSGFGQTGPYAQRPGYDFLAQGMGGLMSLTGEPGGEPMKVGVAVADVMAGMYAAVALLAALRHRDLTGEGQYVDLGLLDTQVAWLINQGMNYLLTGKPPGRLGNAHPNIVPYQVFAAADGHIVLAVGNDAQFRRFCAFAGLTALAEDARFRTNEGRVRHRETLIAALKPALARHPARHWLDGLEQAGVPCGPVNRLDAAFADPQIVHRGMTVAMAHPLAGGRTVPFVANPIKFSETPVEYRLPPPTLGQHTDEVLRALLGLSDTEISALREGGIV